MDSLLQELRYAVRRLMKTPGFTLVILATLALGIGANTAIFSVVNSFLLRALPYRDPGQLVGIFHYYPSLNHLEASVSARNFLLYRDETHSFQAVAVESRTAMNLSGGAAPERIQGVRASAQYFRVLGGSAALGRTLLPEEDAPGRNQVVVLSDGLWHRRFGGQPGIVGKKLVLNDEPYEVVGVMPPDFRDPYGRDTEFWTPLALTPEQLSNGATNEWLTLTARLKPGVTPDQAVTEMRNFAQRLKKDEPDSYPPDWTLEVKTLDEVVKGQMRTPLLVLLGAVGFVLLIACANVANLLLVRASGRTREVAVRAAMGAQRSDLIRQLLVESLLLSLTGGALGLLLSVWGVHGLAALAPERIQQLGQVHLDPTVLLFALGVSVVTGLLFGLVPALQVSRADLQETLREGGRGGVGDRAGHLVRRALVVGEIALALVLLVGAGLLVRSFARLQGVDPGFAPGHVLAFHIGLPTAKYPSDTAQIAFFDQALERLGNTPGVRGATIVSVLPFSGGWSTGSFTVEGYQPAKGQPGPWGDIRIVSPGYAETMRIPLLRGRFFTDRDRKGTPDVAVVDEEMVHRFWPHTDPIGKRLTFDDPSMSGDTTHWITVVGVVGHTKQEALDAENRIQLYLSYKQAGGMGQAWVALRTAGDPAAAGGAARRAIQSLDPDQAVERMEPMTQMLDASLGARRFSLVLLGGFAGLALLLAALGIYGIMSHLVVQRTRELGVRMALGAATGDVLRLVLGQGVRLALFGIVVGMLGGLALTRLMASQLYETRASDPVTFVLVAGVLGTVAVLATAVPALRAARVDPLEALREE